MPRRTLGVMAAAAFCFAAGFGSYAVTAGTRSGAPAPTGWSHFYVRAIDCKETCDFYHRVLGMAYLGSKSSGKKTYYYFQSGSVRLCVGGFPNDPSDYKPRRMTSLNLHLTVDNVQDMFDHIRAEGCDNVSEPRTALWGANTCTLYDPNGVAIALTEWVGKSDWQLHQQLDHSKPFPGP